MWPRHQPAHTTKLGIQCGLFLPAEEHRSSNEPVVLAGLTDLITG